MIIQKKDIFFNQKFVDNPQQCFALVPQVNCPINNLNFHWRWRWWDRIQAIFLNLFYFKWNNVDNYEFEFYKWIFDGRGSLALLYPLLFYNCQLIISLFLEIFDLILCSALIEASIYYSLMNTRQLRCFLQLNQNLTTYHLLIYVWVFTHSHLFLPVANLKLFCFDFQNNFKFATGKNR